MSNHSTVRIDLESKKKLEEIADQISFSLNMKISKATALKLIIDESYQTTVANPHRLFESLQDKDIKE